MIDAFLGQHAGFTVDAPGAGELPAGMTAAAGGWVRVLPGMLDDEGGLDGFFVARLRRS